MSKSGSKNQGPASITISKDSIITASSKLAHSYAELLSEAARYALELSRHLPGVGLEIRDHSRKKFTELRWARESDHLTQSTFTDVNERTKWAAETLSILLLPELTDWRVGVKSNVGTRFDFYVDPNPKEDTLIFNTPDNRSAESAPPVGVEVTGIERATKSNSIKRRRKQKSDNIQKSDSVARGEEHVFVAISELSQPSFHLDTE